MKLIYLDNNATTAVLPAVWEAMQPYFVDIYGNPASSHATGRRARQALEDARERVASLLDALPDEVIFTSGATEANNLAIFGLAGNQPAHVLASSMEHPCITEPLRQLSEHGFVVNWLHVDSIGVVSPAALAEQLGADTRLICVMLANHETGVIQPIADLVRGIGGPPVQPNRLHQEMFFHCDAAAAAGKIPVAFHRLGVTSMTISSHKFHGPKGVGALLVKRHVRLQPQLRGGYQQQGRRPGTEPVPLAIGLATALEIACTEMEARRTKVCTLRRLFLQSLQASSMPLVVNGPEDGGVPHTLNISFPGCRADVLLMKLDLAGVACATGSACSSGSLLPSPVLQTMNLNPERLGSAMRFSLSHLLSEQEVAEAARRIAAAVAQIRAQPG